MTSVDTSNYSTSTSSTFPRLTKTLQPEIKTGEVSSTGESALECALGNIGSTLTSKGAPSAGSMPPTQEEMRS